MPSPSGASLVFVLVLAQAALIATRNSERVESDLAAERPTYTLAVRSKKLIHVTSERFSSITLDTGQLKRRWGNFDFSSAKVQTMTRALSPAYLRMGGTSADFISFKNPCHGERLEHILDKFVEFDMCPEDWDQINAFCAKTGLKLIFGLNLMLRTKDGRWDPSNAEALLDYNTHSVDWELGNEPNAYRRKFNSTLSGEQIGADFNALRSVFQGRPKYRGVPMYGPDMGGIGKKKVTALLDGFLGSTRATNATTFHSYYLNGRTATVDDFLDPDTLDGLLPDQIKLVTSLVADHYGQRAPVWLGESGSAFGGGAPNISDRFVAGFLYLDKLGICARMGLDVVIRQSYYGGAYSMLDTVNLDPNPDYWIAYMYKTLVGPRVLKTKLSKTSAERNGNGDDKSYVRAYAHCTANTSRSGYQAGAVTLILLNMHKTESANITLFGRRGKRDVHQYLMTAHGKEGVTSPHVDLNHRLLALVNDTTLPEISPVLITVGQPILLPPTAYGFYVVPKARAKACMA